MQIVDAFLRPLQGGVPAFRTISAFSRKGGVRLRHGDGVPCFCIKESELFMRDNQPVTSKEVLYPRHAQLITTTDLQGDITFANDDFVAVSGFSREELVGQHHNIIRHPDMPAAAFRDMWQTIQSGHSWKGMVKNRCKNGDYYWVDAYVTPILKNGQVVEYQSVRTQPDEQARARAERLYRTWRRGRQAWRMPGQKNAWGTRMALVAGMPATALAGLAASSGDLLMAGSALLAAMASGGGVMALLTPFRRLVNEASPWGAGHPDLAYLYSGRRDELGRIRYSLLTRTSEMRAIVARLENTCHYLLRSKKRSDAFVEQSNQAILGQGQHVEHIASAMASMLDGQHQVAQSSARVAEASTASRQATLQGREQLERMVQAIDRLAASLDGTRATVSALEQRNQRISKVIDVITDVAEQTNLLALNAAIEAARAGEAGRGFAVVADEVRSLAQRTQESTRDIRDIILGLVTETRACVEAISGGVETSQQTVSLAGETDRAFGMILESVGNIHELAASVDRAMAEQSVLSEQTSSQMRVLRESANRAVDASREAGNEAGKLGRQVDNLNSLAGHFIASLSK